MMRKYLIKFIHLSVSFIPIVLLINQVYGNNIGKSNKFYKYESYRDYKGENKEAEKYYEVAHNIVAAPFKKEVNDWNKAIKQCKKAIQLDSSCPKYYMELGLTYDCKSDYCEDKSIVKKNLLLQAIKTYRKALSLAPRNLYIQHKLANLYYKLGKYKPDGYNIALNKYKLILRYLTKCNSKLNNISKNFIRFNIYNRLNDIYVKQRKYQEAKEVLVKAEALKRFVHIFHLHVEEEIKKGALIDFKNDVSSLLISIFTLLVIIFPTLQLSRSRKEEKNFYLVRWKFIDIVIIHFLYLLLYIFLFIIFYFIYAPYRAYSYFTTNSTIVSIVFKMSRKIFLDLTFIIFISYFVIKKYKHSFKDIGLTLERFSISKIILWGLIGGFICFFLGALGLGNNLIWILVKLHQVPTDIVKLRMDYGTYFLKNPIELSFYIIEAIIIKPIVEEVFIRGFVYTFLRNKMNVLLSAIFSSLLFTSFHSELQGAIGYFLVGIGFAYLYERKKSIIICIIGHSFMNFLMMIIYRLLIYKG